MRFTALSFKDGALSEVSDIDRISELIADPVRLVWLDLPDADEKTLEMLEREFGFHRLALEDVRHGHQRPKIDEYKGYYFLVLYSVSYSAPLTSSHNGLKAREIDMFVGQNYVVTIHRRHVPEIEETMRRWKANPNMLQGYAVSFLLHAIGDAIVDNYFPALDTMGSAIDRLEEKIFVDFNRDAVAEVFALRKDLLALRRLVGPARDVFNILIRHDLPGLDGSASVYFADVYDHLIRVTDTIDTYRELLSSALDGYLSMTSNNLNQIVKVLTSGSIILMSMSLIAGIYGMNFRNMPELDWAFGYYWGLALMAVIAMLLFVFFRRKTWL
ncbi:MAG: magnesium/cobalt transporter CorA [Chloroflexi bacterium]|nr:magnesium/cobalt transporter CorA [Chloroflexota bacterium]